MKNSNLNVIHQTRYMKCLKESFIFIAAWNLHFFFNKVFIKRKRYLKWKEKNDNMQKCKELWNNYDKNQKQNKNSYTWIIWEIFQKVLIYEDWVLLLNYNSRDNLFCKVDCFFFITKFFYKQCEITFSWRKCVFFFFNKRNFCLLKMNIKLKVAFENIL